MSKNLGMIGEKYAADELVKKGFLIVKTNYHSRYGEIDIIAENQEYLIFVEVKTRSKNSMVTPLESITVGKQKKIIKTALIYLNDFPTNLQPRFDVFELISDVEKKIISCEHIENAFDDSTR